MLIGKAHLMEDYDGQQPPIMPPCNLSKLQVVFLCELGEIKMQNNVTKVKASTIVDLLKLDENRNRGQTHGHGQSNIGGIAGCLTLKVRDGASHYIGGFKVSAMTQTTTPRIVSVRAATNGSLYAVHCFAHGTQRPVHSRKAMMHSVRCAGKTPTNANTFAKGAIAKWCNGCVKQYISDMNA